MQRNLRMSQWCRARQALAGAVAEPRLVVVPVAIDDLVVEDSGRRGPERGRVGQRADALARVGLGAVALAEVADLEAAALGTPRVDERVGDRLAQLVAEIVSDVVSLVAR